MRIGWQMVLIICFLPPGVLRSGLKYLEKDAMRQKRTDDGDQRAEKHQSFLNKINLLLSTLLPAPQSSKEDLFGDLL